ncbi:hypothetical protein ACQ1Z2_15625, partial [Enterococcus faecalis]|uniref:hypothetical protein n=1 Tax=Enterococcus faecalis TaxID=1351 RepID=UPI003D6C5B74
LTQGPALFFPPPGVAIKTGRIVTGVVSGKDRNTKIVDGKPTQVYVVYVTVPDSIYKDTVTVTKQKWQDVEAGDPFEVKH